MLSELLSRVVAGQTNETGESSVETDGGTAVAASRQPLERAYRPDPDRLASLFETGEGRSLAERQVTGQFDLDQGAVETLVADYTQAGVDRDGFVAAQGVATEALVEAAFDQLRTALGPDAGAELDAVQADLLEGLDSVRGVTETGVAAYEGNAGTDGTAGTGPFDYHDVVHHVGTPLFVLDPDGEILAWNQSLENLTGVAEAEAQSMEMASMAFYPDGRRGKTLADKVLDAPERTHEKYDVPKVESVDFTLYRDRSVMQDQHGDDRHISFSAAPLYDDAGDLVGVVEMVQDRTDEAERHEAVTSLVDELSTTMHALQAGNLDARATVEDDAHLDDALLDVVDALNRMADQLATMTRQVDTQTAELADAIDQTADAATTVESRVAEQTEALESAAETVHEVSAGMEEVAATSSEVASSAERALSAAEEGAEASETVQHVTDTLTEASEELVGSVTDLESRMDEVNEVVEVIADVAEQTNMLALNANIEAARAGESGSGFAVVADEVKSLANETSEHAGEIADSIETIQGQATQTAEMVETSHEQVERAEDEIEQALDALDEITDAVEAAADGIQEVADANGDQAQAVEDVTAAIEDARTHAEAAEGATEQIVSATEQQTAAVDELVARVDELADGSR
ncbi:methyl-accepting chemotaxis protein [Halomicroarcula sp. GCM10025817]|uniref:methyl-accepting chemotaxis protein n=1 Tax=Haloarcula TaxID=2237 RepID=UPI0023E776F8|nr:methyl-accepting chemotaxis protein [Halomicroarcula sp. SYNS111]